MALTLDALKKMVQAALITRPVEIGCYECLDQIDRFAERVLAGREIPEALRLVQEHLATCGECREEYEALLAALRHMQASA